MIKLARWRKASTREQCIALYPGSNPGRASSLRCLAPPQLEERRPGFAASAGRAGLPRRSPKGGPDKAFKGQTSPCPAVARRAKAGKMPVDGAHQALSRLRNLV